MWMARNSYLLRRTAPGATLPQRLWPHYWIGYLLPILTLIHAWLPMRNGNMNGLNMTGLWLATIAMLLLIWQVGVGVTLRYFGGSQSRMLQTTHFWSMTVLATLIVGHVMLNR